ncbi:AI-2E family transporter [Bacillus massilinigeriensis]|uniref:AI-2E family transporter n=1 Tax=Bacillus mediterraneensis TaxID=1805474 RepID=UPI0008F7EF5F|nr:AI-2E family transporter [Bacillus mediterraneensis]
MWIHKPFFQYATGTLLVLFVIFMLGKIDYFVWPLQEFIAAIFFPVLLSGLLYYILRTPVRLLEKKMPKVMSILIVFTIVASILYGIFYMMGSVLGDQLGQISKQFPEKVEQAATDSKKAMEENHIGFIDSNELKEKAYKYGRTLTKQLGENAAAILSMITSIATVLVVVPFLAFFFLKDDDKLLPKIIKWVPAQHEEEGSRILKDIDKAIFTYVTGQFIIAFTDGVLMYIGYKIIGLEYALILAIFAMLLTIVPFFGPVMGIIPAFLIALLHSPVMAFKVLVILAVVQQLEGNLVTPQVMGRRLDLHPVTVILLLLAAGSLYGFIGILLAIPAYSVLKIVLKDIRKFYRLRQKRELLQQ